MKDFINAASTLFPVFFMIGLGLFSRVKGWLTAEQKEGANKLVFNILFPILIFNVLFTSKIQSSAILIIIYVFIVFILAMVVGKLVSRFIGEEFSHFSYFLLTTCEGGNVALPLYTSIVGVAYATNTVIYDIAGTLIAFIIIPILVTRIAVGKVGPWELLKDIFHNPFVIAVILALVLNLSGFYNFLSSTPFIDLYKNTAAQATAPIIGIILFIIGYNMRINMETIGSLLKLLVIRLIFYVGVIIGFFIFFPNLMTDKIYLLAVLIYFMCPTGFAMPMLISPLYKNEKDEDFTAAFISLFMIITLIVYTFAVLFIV